MPSQVFIFRDPRDGVIRVAATDPGPVLEPLGFRRTTATAPGGVHLETVSRLLSVLPQDLGGKQGTETFIEVTLGDIDLGAFQEIMAASAENPAR